MTGNIIVSTCCLGDMAVNAPRVQGLGGGGGGGGGRLQPYHPRKHVLTNAGVPDTCNANPQVISEKLIHTWPIAGSDVSCSINF